MKQKISAILLFTLIFGYAVVSSAADVNSYADRMKGYDVSVASLGKSITPEAIEFLKAFYEVTQPLVNADADQYKGKTFQAKLDLLQNIGLINTTPTNQVTPSQVGSKVLGWTMIIGGTGGVAGSAIIWKMMADAVKTNGSAASNGLEGTLLSGAKFATAFSVTIILTGIWYAFSSFTDGLIPEVRQNPRNLLKILTNQYLMADYQQILLSGDVENKKVIEAAKKTLRIETAKMQADTSASRQ